MNSARNTRLPRTIGGGSDAKWFRDYKEFLITKRNTI